MSLTAIKPKAVHQKNEGSEDNTNGDLTYLMVVQLEFEHGAIFYSNLQSLPKKLHQLPDVAG